MSADRRWFSPRGPVGRLARRMATSRWFRRIGPRIVPPLDRLVSKLTGGRVLLGSALLPMLVLHTTGRRSGEPRTTPLACLPSDEGFYVVGSNFGRESHPAWTYNLIAHPRAEVEFRGERIPVRAHLLDHEERREIWPRLTDLWPAYDDYVGSAGGRELRVFRLQPVGSADGADDRLDST